MKTDWNVSVYPKRMRKGEKYSMLATALEITEEYVSKKMGQKDIVEILAGFKITKDPDSYGKYLVYINEADR